MTDLVSAPNTGAGDAGKQNAGEAAETAATLAWLRPENDSAPPADGGPTPEWAPSEPAPKKRHLGMWIGIGAGALLLIAGAASTILIAPGTTVAGIAVGGMTPGMASEAISSHLAETEIVLTDSGKEVTVSGADLGVQADAAALADKAFADRPMWKLGSWMGQAMPATITLDPEAAERTLRAAVPASYTEPVDAVVAFDAAAKSYEVTPAVPGTGIDLDALSAAFIDAVATQDQSAEFSAAPTEVPAAVTTEKAGTTAETLNTMLGDIGFYIGEQRTVPVAPAVVASWLTVEPVDGELVIDADPVAIEKSVAGLPKAINRAPVNAVAVVDSGGNVLRTEKAGVAGRELGDTSGIADAFAAQLEKGDATYALNVSETPFKTTGLYRHSIVDLSDQRAYFYQDGELIRSWAISSGTSGHPTQTGAFRIFAHVRIQDMRGTNADGSKYLTKDVPWVTYFNGDQAFHGTYWHENFGTPMSHGCVNMPISAAQWVYEWAPDGFEVTVRN